MRCFFDSNVVIDALSGRKGSVESERKLLYAAAVGEIDGILSAKQMTDIYYVLRKHIPDDSTRRGLISTLVEGFEIVPVDKSILKTALASDIPDFEDAVIDSCAASAKADVIVTKDKDGFALGTVRSVSPERIAEELGI